MRLEEVYRNKKILVTGHTGFKGGWLCLWLHSLGANVVGFSDGVKSDPSLFNAIKLNELVVDKRGDIREYGNISSVIHDESPDYIFHLAAQAIVSESYSDPLLTISTNVMGTANLLSALKGCRKKCVVIIITSDKVYDNLEWAWGYRENDRLGGKDLYSSSKAAADIITSSFITSFFPANGEVSIGIARAGNVIGGGDWSKDRIVPDCYRNWVAGQLPEIRNPYSTRPWQHVLEPLSGYLTFAGSLTTNKRLHGEAFNFGPHADINRSVSELVSDLYSNWGNHNNCQAYSTNTKEKFHEASLLKLNCDKALHELKWVPTYEYKETVRVIGDWYKAYYENRICMRNFTIAQIKDFILSARDKKRVWAHD